MINRIPMNSKIAVIGAGVMGKAIVQYIAQFGFDIVWVEKNPFNFEKYIDGIKAHYYKQARKNRISEDEKNRLLDNLSLVNSSELAGIGDCNIVIEAITENIELKKDVLSKIAEIVPATCLITSNTSSLSIRKLAASTVNPTRVLGLHFFNPISAIKLVEVVKGATTSPEAISQALDFVNKIGKKPVIVNDSPGFIVNRLIIPMINEAIALLVEGVSTAVDIDKAMCLGANHPIGPLALADLIGNDVNLAIMETLHRETGDDKYRPHPHLVKMVNDGLLGRKSARGFYKY